MLEYIKAHLFTRDLSNMSSMVTYVLVNNLEPYIGLSGCHIQLICAVLMKLGLWYKSTEGKVVSYN